MTLPSRLLAFFPLLHLTFIAAAFIVFISHLAVLTLFLIIFSIYLFPLICFHLHDRLYPLLEGSSILNDDEYVAWWGTHQVQSVFNAVPSFESLLRIIPGLYSVWLRLWGSEIGKNVYWTSRVDILDRSLMIVGNQVIFGHRVGCSAHVITKRDNILKLYVKKIQIGENAFIGAGTNIGPGAVIDEGCMLPVLTIVGINQHVKSVVKCENGL